MTPTAAPPRLVTADEFWTLCQLPQNQGRRFDLIRGEVVEVPNPSRTHGVVTNNMGRILGNHAFATGFGYVTSNDSGVVVARDPDSVVGPDVAYFAGTVDYHELPPRWGDDVPALVVEVLSPSDRPGRVDAKVREYLAGGVQVVWVVDPDDRRVTVHRPDSVPVPLGPDAVLDGSGVIPDLGVPVADLFRTPTRPKTPPPST